MAKEVDPELHTAMTAPLTINVTEKDEIDLIVLYRFLDEKDRAALLGRAKELYAQEK